MQVKTRINSNARILSNPNPGELQHTTVQRVRHERLRRLQHTAVVVQVEAICLHRRHCVKVDPRRELREPRGDTAEDGEGATGDEATARATGDEPTEQSSTEPNEQGAEAAGVDAGTTATAQAADASAAAPEGEAAQGSESAPASVGDTVGEAVSAPAAAEQAASLSPSTAAPAEAASDPFHPQAEELRAAGKDDGVVADPDHAEPSEGQESETQREEKRTAPDGAEEGSATDAKEDGSGSHRESRPASSKPSSASDEGTPALEKAPRTPTKADLMAEAKGESKEGEGGEAKEQRVVPLSASAMSPSKQVC